MYQNEIVWFKGFWKFAYYKIDFFFLNSTVTYVLKSVCNGPRSNLDISWHIGVVAVNISIAIH